jgi:protein-S-isoprenylcysteine O-methyltransferase Ste14
MGILVNVIVFLGYFAWGFMLAFDNSIIPISNYISLTIGLIMGVMGVVFIILSTIQKRGFEEIDELQKTGIYRIFRHPMYIGIVFIHIGFPFAFRRLYTLISAIIWIMMILLWKHWEELELEERFGEEYIEYRKRTLF